MNSQFLPLLRNEVVKATRRKVTYFGVVLIGLLCVLIYFVGGAISSAATANAWGYVVFSMQLVFTDLGPICIIMFVAMLVAEETAGGPRRQESETALLVANDCRGRSKGKASVLSGPIRHH